MGEYMIFLKNLFKKKEFNNIEISTEPLPVFKYYLDPLKTNVFVKSKKTCPVCGKKTGYIFDGAFYSTNDVQDICPWCIASGEASSKFDGDFQEWELESKIIDSGKLEEFMKRTPSFHFMNPSIWPCHCEEICVFIDYVGWKDIVERKLVNELENDLKAIREELGCENDDIGHLEKGESSLSGYLFRCPTCGKYRLAVDLD